MGGAGEASSLGSCCCSSMVDVTSGNDEGWCGCVWWSGVGDAGAGCDGGDDSAISVQQTFWLTF